MFNPVAGPRASKAGRIFSAVMDFSRAQQRMHNKLFIADNAMGVTGGRNLGDAYFGNAEAGNFVDLDVLAAGPIVADLSRSFDQYWNNQRAYPVASLISKEELLKMREQVRAEDAAQADDPADDATQEQAQAVKQAKAAKATKATETPASAADSRSGTVTKQDVKEVQKQHAAQFEPMDLAHARFVWAPAVMLADAPAKIAAESSQGPAPREGAAPTKAAAPAAGNADGEPKAEGVPKVSEPSEAARRNRGGRPAAADGPGETRTAHRLALLCAGRKHHAGLQGRAHARRSGACADQFTGVQRCTDCACRLQGAPQGPARSGCRALRDAQRAGRSAQCAGPVGFGQQRHRQFPRHAAFEVFGDGRPVAGHWLHEPGPALRAAKHRNRLADSQPQALGRGQQAD